MVEVALPATNNQQHPQKVIGMNLKTQTCGQYVWLSFQHDTTKTSGINDPTTKKQWQANAHKANQGPQAPTIN